MAAVDSPRTPRRPSFPPTVASARSRPVAESAPQPSVRIAEDTFVSDATLDGWTRGGAAVRAGSQLTTHDGRRFSLRDAVRVLGRRNGDTDPYGLTGKVEAIRDFIRRGANISADALRLGPAVYDIEYGVIATPR
jgi:hypothetical protein